MPSIKCVHVLYYKKENKQFSFTLSSTGTRSTDGNHLLNFVSGLVNIYGALVHKMEQKLEILKKIYGLTGSWHDFLAQSLENQFLYGLLVGLVSPIHNPSYWHRFLDAEVMKIDQKLQ